MGRGSVTPFLLGGPGWYKRKVEALDTPGNLSSSTTEFGWHAGIGLEVMDTAAACRTYNILLGEDRRVAAALVVASVGTRSHAQN